MSGPAPAAWEVHRLVGSAEELHSRALPSSPVRQLWLCRVTGPALVLGSSARQQDFVNRDLARRRGVEVIHRPSGGAAVLLEPGAQLWADVLIGRGDPLWQEDIGRAAWWVGEWWQRTLARVGVTTSVHQGRMQGGELARRICFAGVGPGEVLAEGRKLVGLSQRRTRDVVRLQTMLLLDWHPGPLAALCGLSEQDGNAALAGVAVGLGQLLPPGAHDAGGTGLLAELETLLIEELRSV
ncbi:MAG: lipoyl protein ligase domain-containing protein [Acidimicrobiales bacterium]